MHKLVLLAAAAAGLAGTTFATTPSFAIGPTLCNPFVHQLQCAVEFEWKSGSVQSIDQTKQHISEGDHSDLYGLIQAQLGVNVSIKAGGEQDITQSQYLDLDHGADASDYNYHTHSYGPPQSQLAVNVQYQANVAQTVTQTQKLSTDNDVDGPQQGQTGLNIAVDSHGGSQTITQNQSITQN